ncbi:MAG: tetratricopeptide repeat protein [Deltaproteobacteria bacterium]|nr:tetratricopeptide repeat protein [Deltaproteobacteria bacterium]
MHRKLLSLVLLVLAVAIANPARADTKADARKYFQRGMAFIDSGQYRQGIEELEKAYQIRPHRNVLFNIGRAYASWGRTGKAIEYFERYLATGPEGPRGGGGDPGGAADPAAPAHPGRSRHAGDQGGAPPRGRRAPAARLQGAPAPEPAVQHRARLRGRGPGRVCHRLLPALPAQQPAGRAGCAGEVDIPRGAPGRGASASRGAGPGRAAAAPDVATRRSHPHPRARGARAAAERGARRAGEAGRWPARSHRQPDHRADEGGGRLRSARRPRGGGAGGARGARGHAAE